MNLALFLEALKAIGPLTAAAPAVKTLLKEASALLRNDDDQETAKAALDDLMADNDAGFARLDAKLEAAKRR